MNDTPRTDAAYIASTRAGIYEVFKESQDIERELNAANSEVDRLRKANLQLREGAEEQKQRIKRLEEAVDAYRTAYTPDGHVAPHDCFATGPKTGNPIEDLVVCPGCCAERKAKEAKL